MTFAEILDRHNVRYKTAGQHHHVRDGWIGCDCPWCGPGAGNYHLGINERDSYATCWRCGYHRLGDTLAALTGLPLPDCLDLLKHVPRAPSTLPAVRSRAERVKLPRGLFSLTEPHRRYLRGRGFDPGEIYRLWGVQGIGLTARLAWRLWIPIWHHSELVSWTTRSIGTDGQRYVSASPDEESVDHTTVLYGADHVRHAAVVCEGPLDVWRLGYGAVATLGTAWSADQLEAIAEFPVRAICFDAEVGARRRARKLEAALSERPGETHLIELEFGEDVAAASQQEVDEIRGRFLEGG